VAFDKAIALQLSGFKPADNVQIQQLGGRLYSSRASTGPCVFILLVPHTNRNEFTIEIAWSGSARFPMNLCVGNPVSIPDCGIRADDITGKEYRFRLGMLGERPRDLWWRVSSKLAWYERPPSEWVPECRSQPDEELPADLVESSTATAIQLIVEKGLPLAKR